MKIRKTNYGSPASAFVAGIDGKGPSPFAEIEFLSNVRDGETTLQKIGSDEYESILQSVENRGLLAMPVVMNSVSRIMNYENANKKKLEELAVDTVVKNFGLPDEIREMLEARLETESDLDCSADADDEDDNIELDETQLEIADQLVKRRIVQNALMMGSGYRAHKLFSGLRESLDEIDPRLYPLYETLLPSVEYYLWKYEMPPSARVNWGKCEIVEVDGTIKGRAEAKMFIILLHEVAKIAVEILFLQSLYDIHEQYGEDMKKYVIRKADRYEDEQWMKLIGPRLWKHLHDCIDYIVKSKDNDYSVVSYLLNTIGVLYPENFFAVIDTVVNDGEKAVKLLDEIYGQIREDIEAYKMQLEESEPSVNSKQKKQMSRHISECTIEELNGLLNESVENEEFERAAEIKREIDRR